MSAKPCERFVKRSAKDAAHCGSCGWSRARHGAGDPSCPKRHDAPSEPRLVKGDAPRTLWPPGSKHGPCKNERCNHASCAAIRTEASFTCDICAKPIGYDAPFVTRAGFLHYAHADCLASAHITEAVA